MGGLNRSRLGDSNLVVMSSAGEDQWDQSCGCDVNSSTFLNPSSRLRILLGKIVPCTVVRNQLSGRAEVLGVVVSHPTGRFWEDVADPMLSWGAVAHHSGGGCSVLLKCSK